MQNLPVPAPPSRSSSPKSRAHFTPERQAHFLQRLAQCGNVRAACKSVPISRVTAYRLRRSSSEFAELWDGAQLIARQVVEDVLADRALNGVEEKVFYHGEEVATRRRFSPQLLLAHLARLDRLAHKRSASDAAITFDRRVEQLASGEERNEYADSGDADDYDAGDCDDEEFAEKPFGEMADRGDESMRLDRDWADADRAMEELAILRGT